MLWIIQEYKYWKGLDKTCWSNLTYISESWDDMNGIVEYIEKNDPNRVLRVVKEGQYVGTVEAKV